MVRGWDCRGGLVGGYEGKGKGRRKKHANSLYNRDTYQCKDHINAICELLAVKRDSFSNSLLDAFSEFLCTTYFFTIFLFCLSLLICMYCV